MKKILLFGLVLFISAACTSSKLAFSKGKIVAPKVLDVTLPLQFYSNLPIIMVTIGGIDYRFLFDTGAPMVVDKGLSKKWAMKSKNQTKITDSQGKSQRLRYVEMPPFSLGTIRAEGFVAIEADLKATPALYCVNIDGIVGANFMRRLFWQLNPADSTLRATNDFSLLKVDTTYEAVNFKTKSSGTPVISASLNGTVVPNITFDTGSGGTLGVPASNFGKGYDDSLAVFSVGYHTAGLFGSAKDSSYKRLFKFGLAADTVPQLPISINKPGGKKLLGMGYLKHYQMVLNWNTKKIYLKPIKKVDPKKEIRHGVSPLLVNNKITVGVIYPALLAQQNANHVALGDTILNLNGIDLTQANHDSYCRVLNEYSASDTLKFIFKNKPAALLTKQQLFK